MIVRALLCLAMLAATPLCAGDVSRLVYLGVEDDPFYEPRPLYTGLSLKDHQRPLEAIRLGLRDARVLGRAFGVTFELDEHIVPLDELPGILEATQVGNSLAVLLDLPAAGIEAVVDQAAADTLFINIRDPSDDLRNEFCSPLLLHTAPSYAMLTDALAQHLRDRNWNDVLLLHGPTEEDGLWTAAVRRSAAKFGLDIVADRDFELTNDPRRRDRNNIALLTGGVAHDVVWLVDSVGDFGRYVPFATYAPRPVVGAEGLTPVAWHRTFERYGAPQLNQRFRRLADRDMTAEDWAAWAAIRAISDAVAMARSTDPETVHQTLRSQELSVDLYKGVRGNFRPWNGQLRQSILLATSDAVIAVAPIEGFEHQFDTLDTLGADEADNPCRR